MDMKKREFLRTLATVGKGVAGLLIWNGLGIVMTADMFLRGAGMAQTAAFGGIVMGVSTGFGMLIAGGKNPLDLGRGVYNLFVGTGRDVKSDISELYKDARDKIRHAQHDNNIKTK